MRVPCSNRLIGLVCGLVLVPVYFRLDAFLAVLVVADAVLLLGVGLGVLQIAHHALIGICHLCRQPAVLLLHVGQQRLHRFRALDLPGAHLLRHRGRVAPLGQRLVYVDAALGKVVEVLLGGFVGELHPRKPRDQYGVVALVEAQCRRGV